MIAALGLLVALLLSMFGGPPAGTIVQNVPRGADFLSFWGGATVLAERDPAALYDHPLLWKLEQDAAPTTIRFQNLYPPPIYQAVALLRPLGFTTAARLHLVLMTAWMLAALALLVRAAPTVAVPDRRWTWGLLAVAPLVYTNLLTGQLGGVWLSLLIGGVLLLRRGAPVLGGVVLGVLCAKPSLGAAVAASLLLTSQWAALSGFALGGAAVLGLSLAADGIAPWQAWVEMMTGGRAGDFFVVPQRQLTLGSLLAFPLRDLGWAKPAHRVGIGAGLLAATLLARRARIPVDEPRWPLRFGLVLSAMLLALPHMVDYDLGMHGLALLCSASLVPQARRPRLGIALLCAVFFTPILHGAYRPLELAGGAMWLVLWLAWASSEERAARGAEGATGSPG